MDIMWKKTGRNKQRLERIPRELSSAVSDWSAIRRCRMHLCRLCQPQSRKFFYIFFLGSCCSLIYLLLRDMLKSLLLNCLTCYLLKLFFCGPLGMVVCQADSEDKFRIQSERHPLPLSSCVSHWGPPYFFPPNSGHRHISEAFSILTDINTCGRLTQKTVKIVYAKE